MKQDTAVSEPSSRLNLVNDLLDLFVQVFVEKSLDASSTQRYTSTSLNEDKDKEDGTNVQ